MSEETLYEIIESSVQALELPQTLEEVAAYAASTPGREEVLETVPLEDMRDALELLKLVIQLREYVDIEGPIGFAGLVPLEGIRAKLDDGSAVLDSEEILVILDFLFLSDSVRERLDSAPERYDLVQALGRELVSLEHIRKRISRMFDEHGEVRSDASPELVRLRDKQRSARAGIVNRLEKIVQDRDLARIVQEDYVTMRNDRYVILLRPEFKGLLSGIVHDHSRSGASVYVEPFSIVESNNRVASLSDEEREEIRRIFQEATELIRSVRDEMADNYLNLVRLDSYQARARYAAATRGTAPVISERGFRIPAGRHPLLARSEVIPMDVIQAPENRVTIISGPNMGGKTVALKIAGLFPLMVRCGIPLPAKEGVTIEPFRRIMANIGDEQDIRHRISTFSGHMQRIKTMLDHVGPGDLVLLDELGSATDPEEGAALAMAVMDDLAEHGARVVVTTHLTQLKAYGLSRPEVKNVSVEFHPTTMRPTYKLLYDLPGESHAILTAERIGLPERIIEGARAYLDKSAGGGSLLIQNLKEKLALVEKEVEEAATLRATLESERRALGEEREGMLRELRHEARELLNGAQRRIAEISKSLKKRATHNELKSSPTPQTPEIRPQELMEQLRREISEKFGGLDTPRGHMPEVGARVRLKKFGKDGTVTETLDRGRLAISLGGVNIIADLDDVELIAEGQRKKNAFQSAGFGVDKSPAAPSWEINVIGLRVDEALPIVEKAIDQALLSGLPSIGIIHGKGTGRLRKGIWEFLTGHPLVRRFQLGEARFGGEGVTMVEMATD